jgi:hypothetical protein
MELNKIIFFKLNALFVGQLSDWEENLNQVDITNLSQRWRCTVFCAFYKSMGYRNEGVKDDLQNIGG